jgi:formylglycine-generating enzyme required for sulfatase activity
MTTLLALLLLFSNPQTPPVGTVKVKQYYVDQIEVMNIHWIEFLNYKQKELDSVAYQALLPDSANFWYTSRENFLKPITLITYEQAVAYCAWRSEVVSKNSGRKVTYRLPTAAEWQEIADEILKDDADKTEKELKNIRKKTTRKPEQYAVHERNPKKPAVYDLFSNVSEMTMEKGISMGANNHNLTTSLPDPKQLYTYSSPGSYLGFRCIAEVD